MTDKEKKIREVIEKRYEYWKEKEHNSHSTESEIRMSECQYLLLMVDSLQEEPVSEPNKQLAETYLAVFDKKFPILPTLKGKQLADYKDFLNKCQQIFSLKEWGIRPIQAKLFEKLSLLWAAWGAEHLQGIGVNVDGEQDEEFVSEELEEAAKHYLYSNILYDDVYVGNLTDKDCIKMFKAGAEWKTKQFEI